MENNKLLLTNTTTEFRSKYPELIAQWEREFGNQNCNPDLHFCLYTLEEYPDLEAYLRAVDYRIDFAINAHIVHAALQRDFVFIGHTPSEALEMANKELKGIYHALNGEPIDARSKLFRAFTEHDLKAVK